MILRNTPTFYGTLLLPFIVLLVWQRNLVLGQDETQSAEVTVTSFEVKDDGITEQEDEACPCILKTNCPRVYGSNPLDYSEIGQFEPCKQDGFVRCCGVSVSVVQATDDIETQYEDGSSSWDLSESDHDHQDFSTLSDNLSAEKNEDKDNGKPDEELHELAKQQEQHDSMEMEDNGKATETQKLMMPGAEGDMTEENKSMKEDKESGDDLISAASDHNSYTVIVQPPGDPPKKRFQPKFPRYRRPGTVSASDNDDNAGNNDSNEKTLPDEEKIKTNNNIPSYGNGGSGNVVYSQRVSEFSPYRRRNNVITAPVFTITPSDSSNDSKNNGAESDNGEAITATSRPDRPKYQMKRRRPFNQMRNRVKAEEQTENVKASEIETNDEEKPEKGSYGPSSSPDESSPAPFHVPETESSPESDKNPDQLDNQRRPMSRLIKPRVNALNRRKPTENGGTKSVEQNQSSDNNNSYGSTPTLDNGVNQESSQLQEETKVLETRPNVDDNKATIGSAEEESSIQSSSSAKTYENSPTGKLVPIRPTIRPFARKNPNPISINSEESTTSADIPVNQNEGEDTSSASPVSPNSYDPIKSSETPELKKSGVYIRKVPMRRVRPNPATVITPEKQEIHEDSIDASDAPESSNLPDTTPPKRGKIIMRRPINSAYSASLQMKDDNSPEKSSPSSSLVEQEGQNENAEVSESPVLPKIQKLDIRRKLLGRNHKNPLRGSASSSETEENVQENENVEPHVETVKPPVSESVRPNNLRRRRPLRKPSTLGQSETESITNEPTEAVTNTPDDSASGDNISEKEEIVDTQPIKIRKGPGRHPLLRRKPQSEKPAEIANNDTEKSEQALDSDIPKEETTKPFLLRQRNRMSANNRGRKKNPTLPQTSEKGEEDESQNSTSETPVTVTSTYSRIRINNNKNGMVARPTYRRPVKPSSAPAIIRETETESTDTSPDNVSTTDSSSSNRVSGYGTRKRVRVQQISPEKSADASVPPTPSENVENVEGSNNESEKQGQLSQPNENLEGNSSQPPKRRKFGRKRVKVVKPQQQQEQEQRQQDYTAQETTELQQQEQQQLSPQEDLSQQIHQEGDIRQSSEHVTSTEEAVTSHYPNRNQFGGSDEVKQEQQSEDQSPLPGNFSSHYENPSHHTKIVDEEEKTVLLQNPTSPDYAEYQHVNNPGSGNIGHENIKIADADDNDAQDKKVSSYYQPVGEGENEPYDLILNQDVRKNLGTQGTHFAASHAPNVPSSAAYQVYSQNSEIEDGYHHHQNHPESLSSPQSHVLNQDDKFQQHSGMNYYDPYYYDPYGNNQIQGSNPDNTKYSGVHDDYSHYDHNNNAIPNYAHHYSGGAVHTSTGGIETIEFGTPDYDANPYDSWYAYGEGQEDEEESRVSMKFFNEKSKQNKSSQVLGTSTEESMSENGSSNNNSNDNDNEDKGADISRVKVGPSRVIQRTVNHSNVSSSQNNAPHHRRPDSQSTDNATGDIRKDASSSIRQKLRRPPSAYINNSAEAHNKNNNNRVPTTSAPFTPSLQSPRPTYSGQEALLESVNQSVHSLPKSENLPKSPTYPNPEQLEQFIQNKKQITPPERKNRTRVRVKMVTLRTTTPVPVTNADNEMGLNENEQNVSPGAPSSSLPHSGFTFPPFKKSELTLIPSTTETPLEDDAPVPYSYSPPVLPPFKATSPSTAATTTRTTASSSSPILRKPLRNSFSSNHNQGLSELPKTSAQVGGHDRHIPKANSGAASTNGRFRISGRNQTVIPAPPTHSQPPSTISQSSSDSESRTTRRPLPRIKSPAFIRKFPAFTTTETPVPQEVPEANNVPLAYSIQENEIQTNIEQDLTPPVPLNTRESDHNYNKPESSVPERETEVISIRIEPQPNEIKEFEEANEVVSTSTFAPSGQHHVTGLNANSIHYPSPHSFQKVNGKEQSNVHESKGKKKKYTRFKIPEKFNLPKPTALPNLSQGEKDDYGYDEYNSKVEPVPPFQHNQGMVQVAPPTPTQPMMPIAPSSQSHFSPEPHNPNDNLFGRPPLPPPSENVQNLESPHVRLPIKEEQEYFVAPEPEIVPDIRINVFEPTVEQQTSPKPLLLATREPEHFNNYAPPEPEYFNHYASPQAPGKSALRNSPFGPFPSTDHWSGIPSPNGPRLPEYFQNNREPSQNFEHQNQHQGSPAPPPVADFFEHNREPLRLPPQPQENAFDNRRPIHPQPNFTRQPPSNVVFEHNQDFGRPNQQPFGPPTMHRPHGNPVHFEEDEEEEDDEEPIRRPPPQFQETNIKFGTAFEENGVKEITMDPQRPSFHPPSGRIKFPDSIPMNPPPVAQPQFNQIRDGPVEMPPMRPLPLPNRGLQHEPIQLPLPSPVMPAQPPQTEVVIPPVRIEGQALNEAQQPIFKPQLPSLEPVLQAAPQNSMPIQPIMYEISNGELKTPHYPAAEVAETSKPNFNLPPHLRQSPEQLPIRHQNVNLHVADFPVNNNQPPPRAPHIQQRPEVMNHFPPQHQNVMENVVVFEGNQDAPLRPNNAQLLNPNILVQVDGRPHDAIPINPGNNIQKPLDRPGSHVIFEKEPELKIQSHLPNTPHSPLDNNFQSLSHQVREPVSKPLTFPQSPQIKFPETNLQGFPERPPPRPGQFGPPPPSQQNQPQYVPFGSNGERFKLNETERPVQNNLLAHPPVMPPPPPPHFSNGMKYAANQPRPPYMPYQQQQQQQHQQHFPQRQNGFMAPPMQSYPPNYRPPPPQMRVPGYPRGPYGNNPYFQQRLRGPNARTSRAANLTAEEEKALTSKQAVLATNPGGNEEQESLADQQAILFLEGSGNEKIGLNSEEEQRDQIDNEKAKPSQFASELRAEGVISPSESLNGLPAEKTNDSENQLGSSAHRQQRELNINGTPRSRLDKTNQRDPVLQVMHEYRDNHEDMAVKEVEDVKLENFGQDELSRESGGEQASIGHPSNSMPHSTELGSQEHDKVEEEGSDDNPLKLSKKKKFAEHKDKQDSTDESNGRPSSSPSFSAASTSSSESKKSYMKGKNANSREKSGEEIHQNSGKMMGNSRGENEFGQHQQQQGQHSISSINPDEIQDQQEFVAPTVIQRGFHPILPYSEKDPGPILVPIAPKVEKFLPPSMNPENRGAPFQILSPTHASIAQPSSVPLKSSFSSIPLNHQAQESKSPFLSKQLNSNNHLAVLQTNTLANNQTPFKTLTSNHLTTGSV